MSNAIRVAPRKRARRWNESEAAEALRECAKSGLPLETYAKREGYSGQRLRNWRRRLGGELTVAPVSFVPVTVAESDVRAHDRGSRNLSIEVGRVKVRLREDLDVEHLARIVGALDRITR